MSSPGPSSPSDWAPITSWMCELSDSMDLSYKVTATAIALLDRVINGVQRDMIQLYGCTCLYIASIMFDDGDLEMTDVVDFCNNIYTLEQVEESVIDITVKCTGRYFIHTSVTILELEEKAAFYALTVYLDRQWLGVDPIRIAIACIGLATNETSYDMMEYAKDTLHNVKSYVKNDTKKQWIDALGPGLSLDNNEIDYIGIYNVIGVIDPNDDKVIGKAGTNNAIIRSVTNGPYKYARKLEPIGHVIPDVSVMAICDHPNIVKLKGVNTARIANVWSGEDEINLGLYMELMATDLHRLIYDDPGFIKREWTSTEKDKWRLTYISGALTESRILPNLRRSYTRDICKGIEYLHTLGILHRDIKPGNVLIDNDTAKVCDFGLSTFGVYENTVLNNDNVYTYMYRPLEVINEEYIDSSAYGQPADVFALGATLIELEVGLITFAYQIHNTSMTDYDDHERVITEVINGELKCIYDDDEYRKLLLRMVALDPDVRPTMAEIVTHPSIM